MTDIGRTPDLICGKFMKNESKVSENFNNSSPMIITACSFPDEGSGTDKESKPQEAPGGKAYPGNHSANGDVA